MSRIEDHPIVRREWKDSFTFTYAGKAISAYPGDVISSALFAAGIRVFGHHLKDGAPQGIFCANGQCAQCLVIADGLPVKACMTEARPDMVVGPVDGLPRLPGVGNAGPMREIEVRKVSVLILGAGPAGLSAAIELGSRGVDVLLVDDKERLGGKLVLQTHRFFGSTSAVYAGTRGIDIGTRLEKEVRGLDSVEVWIGSTALAIFGDRAVGVLRRDRYILVRPEVLLVATGAREKSIVFDGNTLPGVYGAGAFQTLVNRDLVKAADRLFIVGGGNVGLIAGYHALQAGIDVVGLVEALPECGGYKVHKDKLARLGVPIYTSHTILSANGADAVKSVTVAQVDTRFRPIPGTEKSFACDTVLIAVGLDPVDELLRSAREVGLPAYAAGDAEEIAEASAAIFSGKIRGLEIARALGRASEDVPESWRTMGEILKSKPGATTIESIPEACEGVVPVFHCSQEIPCDPCTSVCPRKLIELSEADVRSLPRYAEGSSGHACSGCDSCVAVCPGLAITLVDFRKDADMPTVTLPMEFGPLGPAAGTAVTVLGTSGEVLGEATVQEVKRRDRTLLVRVRLPRALAKRAAGIQLRNPYAASPLSEAVEPLGDEAIVCRCERVTAGEIRARIRAGMRDTNEIKAVTRAGMGACGGKTCTALIARLFREEGVLADDVTENVRRPLFVEVRFGAFAGVEDGST
jgi:NADPH-dependent 2,4-dienoyl-CoA reductase/sulfur reductase-like enzyme/Pyruvate/2-oxoacid:ferredoxin oxidoreductase delta subunit/bacterioferritin-associated ferredoxin